MVWVFLPRVALPVYVGGVRRSTPASGNPATRAQSGDGKASTMFKKRMPTSSKHRGVEIRRRGQSGQVDYGVLHGKRVQRSFPTTQCP